MDQQDPQSQKQKLSQNSLTNVSVPDFLLKTYQILEDNKYSTYISWNKDGTMIMIKKPLAFAEEVLPGFFKHSNLSSFIRQLNNYSFRKMKSKEFEYCFYHEMFRKDRKDLLKYIKRKKSSRSKGHKHGSKHSNASKKAQSLYESASSGSDNDDEVVKEKKVHIEEKPLQDNVAYLKRVNQKLKDELAKRQAQDKSLRHVIGVLMNYYGPDNVQTILKMAAGQKTEPGLVNPQLQGDANKLGYPFVEHSPNQAIIAQPTQGHLNPEGHPQEFIEYDLFHNPAQAGNGLHRANNMVPGPIESLENFTALSPPHLQGDQANSFKYGLSLNQQPGVPNMKQESDFLREEYHGIPPYQFSNLPNPF